MFAFELRNYLNFGLHVLERLNLLRVEVHLTSVPAHQLEHIVEHKVPEAIVDWDFHVHDEGSSLDVVRNFFPISYEKVATVVIQISDERIKISPRDVASGLWVVPAPQLSERVDIVLFDGEVECFRLADEGVDHDSNEQVEEDQRHHNHEGEEVDSCCQGFPTAVRDAIIVHNRLVGRVLVTLEGDAPLPHSVSHDRVPAFTSGTAE